jgi:hypothetical protein
MTRVNVGLEYRGFDLMTRGWTVKALGLPESVPARRGENLVVPGRPGRFLTRKPLDQRVVTVAILVDSRHPTIESEARTDVQLWENLDALRKVLAEDGPGELRYTTPGGTRVARAEVTSFVEFKPEGPWSYSALVEFTLADPFWYDETPVVVGPTAIIQNPQNFSLSNPGTYWSEPKITLTGPAQAPRFEVGAIWMECGFNLSTGQTLVIDVASFSAKVDGVERAGLVEHDGHRSWLIVPAGVSTLVAKVAGFGTGTTLKIEWTPRYV